MQWRQSSSSATGMNSRACGWAPTHSRIPGEPGGYAGAWDVVGCGVGPGRGSGVRTVLRRRGDGCDGGYGWYVAQQVTQQAAGAVDGLVGAGKAAQDGLVDGGDVVPSVQPAGRQAGQLVEHAPGDQEPPVEEGQ